ncbi:hypothetical protein BDZ94DRAFT_1311348 [Collybia nuda]|uniref:Uncharacterized protein n=1 Tax=Collybia nuda TaxID=64659 RepID=A0A9P6CCF3_9AGAR|nr:hypothetical protein BDZ94DRAFT_1311348 [Collybia nuda]
MRKFRVQTVSRRIIVSVKVDEKPPHICALVHRMQRDKDIPAFPWDLYASTLGIHTTYADWFDAPKIIPISRINSPLALIPIHSQRIQKDLWVSVSFDHASNSVHPVSLVKLYGPYR